MTKKISIIIPVYNTKPDYIRESINSVLNQTYKNIEIIIVNDGSTDKNTIEYLKSLDISFIKIINQENKGAGGARNTGIENSTGEYISFLDSDDWLDNNYYEILYNLCEKNNADIACATLARVETDREIKMDMYKNCVISNFAQKMKYITNGSTCSKLFRKELFSDIRFPENIYYEDNIVLIKLFVKSKKAAFTNKIRYHYRKNPKSITLNDENKQKARNDCLIVIKDICQILENKSQKEKDIVLKRFVPHLIDLDFYNNNQDYQKQIKYLLGKNHKKYLEHPKSTVKMKIFSIIYFLARYIKKKLLKI